MKWAVTKSLDSTGGHVFCRISAAVLSCRNGLREMKRLILDENPVAIVYLQRSHIFVHKIELIPRPCKIRDHFGYLTNNYTKPACRNRGIGSELMQRVKDWAKDEDLELLIVYPSEEAVTFYERAGFYSENDVMELRLREY